MVRLVWKKKVKQSKNEKKDYENKDKKKDWYLEVKSKKAKLMIMKKIDSKWYL